MQQKNKVKLKHKGNKRKKITKEKNRKVDKN